MKSIRSHGFGTILMCLWLHLTVTIDAQVRFRLPFKVFEGEVNSQHFFDHNQDVTRPTELDEEEKPTVTTTTLYEQPRIQGIKTYDNHTGTDFPGREIYVVAAASGYIIEMDDGWGFSKEHPNGNFVRLYHGIDELGRGITSVYLHLEKGTSGLDIDGVQKSEWDYVTCGTKIGESGQSGLAFGYHLHFETQVNGLPFDPYGTPSGGEGWWTKIGLDQIPGTDCGAGLEKLVIGDRVRVVGTDGHGLSVRKDLPCSAEKLKTRNDGDMGEIIGGPRFCDNHLRWEIKWADSEIGWSAHPWLEKVTSAEFGVEETPGSGASGFVNIISFLKGALDSIKSFFVKIADASTPESIPTHEQLAVNSQRTSVYSLQEDISIEKVISEPNVQTFDEFVADLSNKASTVTKTTGFGIAERTVYTVNDALVVIDEPLPELFKIDVGPAFCLENQARIHVSIPFVKNAIQFDIYDRLTGSVLRANIDRDHTLVVNPGQDYQIYVKATGEFGDTESVNTESVAVSPEICSPGAMAGIQNLEIIPAPGHDDKIRLTWSDTMPWTAEYVFEVWNEKELVFTQTVGWDANSDTISMDIPLSGGKYYVVSWIRERDGSNSSAKFVSEFVDIQGYVPEKQQLSTPFMHSVTVTDKTITINFDGELQEGHQFIVDIESGTGTRDKIVLPFDSRRDVSVNLGDGTYDVSMQAVDPSGTFLPSAKSDVSSVSVLHTPPVSKLEQEISFSPPVYSFLEIHPYCWKPRQALDCP